MTEQLSPLALQALAVVEESGAIINARIAELRYGAREEKSGCCGSVLNLFEERFNHRPRIYGGLLAEESSALLREFFQKRREKDETVV